MKGGRATFAVGVLLWVLAPVAMGSPALGAGGACAGANLRPNARNAAAVERATLCLLDQVRAAHQLRALRSNGQLRGVAASQVSTMVSLNYFADVRPSGETPMSLVVVTRYPAHAAAIAVGQNIAWATGADSTPSSIVAAWMRSPAHRAVILTAEYRDAGVAVKPALPGVLGAGRHGATYAMEFGMRRF